VAGVRRGVIPVWSLRPPFREKCLIRSGFGSVSPSRVSKLTSQTTTLSPDRRSKCRFPIEHELRYKLLARGGRVVETGTGKSLNISSAGIWFNTPNLLRNVSIELSLDWPVLLHNARPMLLVIYGSVIRSNDEGTAATIERHEFRTRGSRTLQVVPFNSSGTAKLA
jgi:hypothetical protein